MLRDLGDLTGARTQYERALQISEAALGPDHPDIGHPAQQPRPRAAAIWGTWPAPAPSSSGPCRSARPPSAPTTPTSAIRRNNLGRVLRDLGDLAGARTQYERALQISEAALGPDHPDIGHLAQQPRRRAAGLGDLPGARTQLERALQISEAALGPDHPTHRHPARQPRPRAAAIWGRVAQRPPAWYMPR